MFMKFYFIVIKFVVYHFVIELWAVLGNKYKTFLFTEYAYTCACTCCILFSGILSLS